MQKTHRFIGIALVASITLGGIALGMEPNARYNTGEVLQKLLESKPKAGTSVADYQSSQNDSKKAEIEAKKKELYARFEAQKKQILLDAESAKKTLTEKINGLSETEKASQKESLYAQYKQIGVDAETKIKELKIVLEGEIGDLKSQYEKLYSTKKQDSTQSKPDHSAEFAAIDAKKKELNARFETQKMQIKSDAEAARKAFTEKANSLSETEKAAQKESLTAQYKLIGIDAESKIKQLQSEMEAKMKALKSEYQSLQGVNSQDSKKMDSTVSTKDKEKMKQELKDKLSKVGGGTELSTVCKATFETIRSERAANEQERKAARSAFWDTNKGAKKDIFLPETREDVKDELDLMRLQVRLAEKNFMKGLYATSSTVTLEKTLTLIDTIVTNTRRINLEQYVQDGKTEQFNTFRDGFTVILNYNKKSLLSLAQSHAKTIMGLDDTCKKKAKVILSQTDSSDRQNQSQLNSMLKGGSESSTGYPTSTEKKVPQPATKYEDGKATSTQ